MSSEEVRRLISVIGLLAQLGGAVLLVALFFLLFHNASRRRYFLYWGRGWLALAVGLSILVLRYRLLPGGIAQDPVAAPALHAGYLFAKVAYFALLAAGTAAYCSGLRLRGTTPYALAGLGAYTLFAVTVSPALDRTFLWQCAPAIAALAYSCFRFLRLPPSRRSLGSRATGTIFGIMSVQWAMYFVAFGFTDRFAALPAPVRLVVQFNPYFDLLAQVLLGYGMVVLLMEDAKREVDDAHAELAVAHDQLRRDSLYDALTGCLNRRAFVEQVALEGARASFGAVMMVDLDDLKTVNDTRGHAAGDDLLRTAADVLRRATRPSDRLFRWGGDEFLLLMPGALAVEVQPRLEERIGRLSREAHPEGAAPLRVSLGSADYADAEGLEAAIDAADRAMYAQKARRKQDLAEVTAGS